MKWPAPAKLNLFLYITGRRPDGYHNLQTLFQFVEYGDTLTITTRQDEKVLLTTLNEDIPDSHNLVYRAARLLQEQTRTHLGAEIILKKEIPIGGGLGGGSSDAATTLVVLNQLWKCGLNSLELQQLGLTLGADIPFFIRGEASFAEGVGEHLQTAQPQEKWYLILSPGFPISTPLIFNDPELTRDTPPLPLVELMARPYQNDCEAVVKKLFPKVEELISWLLECAPARLTGTGSCIFSEFTTRFAAEEVLLKAEKWGQATVARGCNISPLHHLLFERYPESKGQFQLTGKHLWQISSSSRDSNSMTEIKLFTGNATPDLARNIAARLYINLGNATVGRFSDGEVNVQINENVRGDDIFIIQSTCYPTNDNLMELLVMVDALRRASAGRITAVIPYFGYARQDRRIRSARVPITAKIVADFISNVGVDRVLTVDLHAEQIQGFFDVPVDNVFASPVLIEDIRAKDLDSPVVISPDIGGVVRARAIAKLLSGTDIAIIDKRRPHANTSQVMNVIGDVSQRDCILIDDIIDTGGTLCKAAEALKNHGANRVFAYATHPVFSGNALEIIAASAIDEVVVTDTIPLPARLQPSHRVRTLTMSRILAEAIRRISNEESISAMFNYIGR